jgi:hypothetical protein
VIAAMMLAAYSQALYAQDTIGSGSTVPEISLTVRWFEVSNNPEMNAGINKLLGEPDRDTHSPDGSKPPGAMSGVVATTTILDWTIERRDNGSATPMLTQRLTRPAGQKVQFRHGRTIDLAKSAEARRMIQNGAAEDATNFTDDVAIDPHIGFEGTAIRASAGTGKHGRLKLGAETVHTTFDLASARRETGQLNLQRVVTNVEILEGQSLVTWGRLPTRTITQIQRVPLFGDIPFVGPLIFSKKDGDF